MKAWEGNGIELGIGGVDFSVFLPILFSLLTWVAGC